MTILPKDGWFTFMVVNDEGTDTYTVDLVALDGNGQCDCANFRMVRAVNLESKQVEPRTDAARCKHIHACRQVAAEGILNALIQFMVEEEAAGEAGLAPAPKRTGRVHSASCPFCQKPFILPCLP